MTVRSSRAFRSRLRSELERWRAEGLVDERTAAAIAARYPDDGGTSAAGAILLLGGALVGLGVIALVAYNWEELPRALKLGLLGIVMSGLQLAGFWLWRGARPRLGQALVLAGVLFFGANIGLVAQIYQVHDVWYGGVGAFAAGSLAAALLLESAPIAALSCGLMALWAAGRGEDFAAAAPWIAHLCAFGFLALTLRLRTAPLGVVAVLSAAVALAPRLEGGADALPSFLTSCLLLAAFTSSLRLAASAGADRLLRPAARAATGLFLLAAYVSSFAIGPLGEGRLALGGAGQQGAWLIPPALAAVVLLAAALRRRGTPALGESPASGVILAGGALLVVGLAGGWPDPARQVVANLALVAFGAAAIGRSVRRLERGSFWTGILLLGLVAATRFLDLDLKLWVKGLGFIVSGVLVLAIGLAFERHLQLRREAGHAA